MGTMVGDDGGDNKTGMAPGARWIGCRNMDRGVGTPATYAECYQWFIAPTDLNDENPRPDLAPDVINNSWGCPPSEGCTEPDVLLAVVDNVRAAGILSVHSAGNEGFLGCGSVSTPGAIYDSSFTVGNTNNSDSIAGSSSRGPVLVDGSGRPKPDISAPGTGIRSSVPGTSYLSMSGTSMAGPHVAGLAALLISANPELAGQVDALENLIKESALQLTSSESCGSTADKVPNNTYGWGRIDAWAAYQLLVPQISYAVSFSPAQNALHWPGFTSVFTHTLTNKGAEPDSYHLSLSSSQGWAVLGTESPVALGPGEAAAVTVTVSIPVQAGLGAEEVTQLTATSQTNSGVSAAVSHTTTVGYSALYPLIFSRWPSGINNDP
jgi:subtilisin family serine protease